MGQTGRQMRARTKGAIGASSGPRRQSAAKVGGAERLRYAFDNSMARGTPALVAWLAAATFVLILVFGTIVALFNMRDDDPGAQHQGFFWELFQALMHALDPGTVAGDSGTWRFLLTMLALTLAGLFIVSALIGIIAAGIDAKIADLQRGRSRVIESGHTVILGWSEAVYTILAELAVANESAKSPVVVILADRDKVEMEEDIREKLPDLKGTRVVCRSGSPIDLGDLALSSPEAARSIIVLGSGGDDPDSEVIKTLLALTHNSQDGAPIVAEISDPENLGTARMLAKGRAVIVDKRGTVARLIVQTSRQSGAAAVYTELFDFDGDEIYFHSAHGAGARAYGDVLNDIENVAVIGLLDADGTAVLNPAMDTVIGEQALIVVASDDSALNSPPASSAAVDEGAITAVEGRGEQPSQALLLGWNERAYTVVQELDAYAEPGSTLTILTEMGEPVLPDLANLTPTIVRGRTTARSVLDQYVTTDLDQIIVLCYSDDLDVQQADARTLVTLLHVRDIVGDGPESPAVVSELLDDRNRALAEVAAVDDVIVSDKILSLMLSQLSEDRRLEPVFIDLLDADGAEIYLRPADWYVRAGSTVSFATIVEAARRRGETAFGYRAVDRIGSEVSPSGVFVNPGKAETFTISAEDRVVVLAED
ncbi:voltage-gated potassium channel Kch [Marmoricola sp. OAE513]|uniref:CASTOR/POLLUX-related putative ion channel n=1 Tax=Marmoricola sp. OAE513 TaxID=2817894 RepID=UPI001AE6A948